MIDTRVSHFVGVSLVSREVYWFFPAPRCALDTIVYRSGSFLEFSFSRTRISRARKSRSNGGVSGCPLSGSNTLSVLLYQLNTKY